MRYILLLTASLALLKTAYGQLSIDDEFMSSPTVTPTQNETDLFRINGVIILLTVGSCVFALLWLILFMYFALLCYGYRKKKNLEEKREGYYRQAAANPLGDTEMEFQFQQAMQTEEDEDEFRLPEENQAFSRTFSQESEHVTTFQRSSSQSRLMESTDGAGGRAAKKNKREEEEEEEESDSEERGSEEDSEDESEEDSEESESEEEEDGEEEEGSEDFCDDSDDN